MGWVVIATPQPFYPPEKRPVAHSKGGWVGLNGREKSLPHRESIPGPSSTYRVAIPTTLSRPTLYYYYCYYYYPKFVLEVRFGLAKCLLHYFHTKVL